MRRDPTHRSCARASLLFPLTLPPLSFFIFLFSLYIAHLLRGERVLEHVDRGVTDGVVSYVALSQDGAHLGVNLPRLSAAMQEVPVNAPSSYVRAYIHRMYYIVAHARSRR
jgi:hypothetical protein